MNERIDVLAVMDAAADVYASKRDAALERDDSAMAAFWRQQYANTREARAAVAELIEAVTQDAVTKATASGLGVSEWSAFLSDRVRAALTRVGGA